jgi:hypothetical protein
MIGIAGIRLLDAKLYLPEDAQHFPVNEKVLV